MALNYSSMVERRRYRPAKFPRHGKRAVRLLDREMTLYPVESGKPFIPPEEG